MNERKYVLKNRPPPILARKAGLPLFCPSFVIGTRPRRVRADISWKCPNQEAEGRAELPVVLKMPLPESQSLRMQMHERWLMNLAMQVDYATFMTIRFRHQSEPKKRVVNGCRWIGVEIPALDIIRNILNKFPLSGGCLCWDILVQARLTFLQAASMD